MEKRRTKEEQNDGGVEALTKDELAAMADVNPFEYDSQPSMWELFKITFFFASLISVIRLFFIAIGVLLVFFISAIGTLGVDKNHIYERPLSPFRRAFLAPIGGICRIFLFILGFYHIEVVGKLSPDACFIVPNHCSLFDAVIMYWLCRPAAVAKAEIFGIPVLGRIFRAIQIIPVKRESKQAREETKELIQKFAESQSDPNFKNRFPQVLIFPQGTTTMNKRITMFQRGAFIGGLPVQPVAIDYSQNKHFNPAYVVSRKKDYFLRRHFTQFTLRAKVTFLPLYRPNDAEKADATLFANNVRQVIADSLGATCTNHTFEDAKLYKHALDLQEEKHILNLLETPSEYDKVHLKNLQIKEVKDIFHGFGLEEIKETLDVFKKLDKNNDGTLDYQEFCCALGLNSQELHAAQIFNFFDKNNDGSIDFRELVLSMAICSPEVTISLDEKSRFVFDLFDENQDGFVTEEELFSLLAISKGGSFHCSEELRNDINRFVEKAKAAGAKEQDDQVRIPYSVFRSVIENEPAFISSAISRFRTDSFPMVMENKENKKSQ